MAGFVYAQSKYVGHLLEPSSVALWHKIITQRWPRCGAGWRRRCPSGPLVQCRRRGHCQQVGLACFSLVQKQRPLFTFCCSIASRFSTSSTEVLSLNADVCSFFGYFMIFSFWSCLPFCFHVLFADWKRNNSFGSWPGNVCSGKQ